MPVRKSIIAKGRLSLLLAPAVGLLACGGVGDVVGPERDASPIQTDATVYRLQRTSNAYSATAMATYVNHTGTSVYYARCGVGGYSGPLFGLRRTGPDSTRTLWTDIAWACVGGVPTGELRPGDSVTVGVRLGAYDQPTMSPPLRAEDIVGLMRVVFQLCAHYTADSDYCQPLPGALRESNAFDVRY